MKKNWYAVYTKAHCETKVASLLSKKRIENICPLNRIVSVLGNKTRIVYEPLFPCFVFVYISEAEMEMIRQVGSIVNFVYWLGRPAVIRVVEIENIQHFSNRHFNIKLEKSSVNVNGIVKVISEPDIDMINNLISIKNSHFRLMLPSLGYMLIAEIEQSKGDLLNYASQRDKMVM